MCIRDSYALLVYGLLGWERLARRYKKRNIPKNTSIALTPPHMGGYKVTSSQHNYGDTLRLVEDEVSVTQLKSYASI